MIKKTNLIKDTARGLVLKEDKILLMERWRNGRHYFSIPGGKIEPGEEPRNTSSREILEETGVKVHVGNLIAELKVEGSRHYIYLCKYIEGEPSLQKDSEEARVNDQNNRFKPGWQHVSKLESLDLLYWEPLKLTLVMGISDGFGEGPVIVEV